MQGLLQGCLTLAARRLHGVVRLHSRKGSIGSDIGAA